MEEKLRNWDTINKEVKKYILKILKIILVGENWHHTFCFNSKIKVSDRIRI